MKDLPTIICSYCQSSNDYVLVPTMLGNIIKPPRFCALCRRSLATPQLQQKKKPLMPPCRKSGFPFQLKNSPRIPNPPGARQAWWELKHKVRISASQVLLQDLAL